MNAHAIPLSHFNELDGGMTAARALKVFGSPSDVHKHGDGSQTWTYDRGTWCNIKLRFSPSGQLVAYEHDH